MQSRHRVPKRSCERLASRAQRDYHLPKRCRRRACSSRLKNGHLAPKRSCERFWLRVPLALRAQTLQPSCVQQPVTRLRHRVPKRSCGRLVWRALGIACPNAAAVVRAAAGHKSRHRVPKRSCERLALRARGIACPSVLPPSCVQQPIKEWASCAQTLL